MGCFLLGVAGIYAFAWSDAQQPRPAGAIGSGRATRTGALNSLAGSGFAGAGDLLAAVTTCKRYKRCKPADSNPFGLKSRPVHVQTSSDTFKY